MSESFNRNILNLLPLPGEEGDIGEEGRRNLLGLLPIGESPPPPEPSDTLTVEWRSTNLLACANCEDSEVILCIKSEKIAAVECVADVVGQDSFARTTIRALYKKHLRYKNSCGRKYYVYLFEYTAAQVVGDGSLACDDILGAICAGCLTKYVQEQAGGEVILYETEGEPNQLRLVSQHGCIYEFLKPGPITFTADEGDEQVVYPYEEVNILGGEGIKTTASDTNNILVDLDLSDEDGQMAEIDDEGKLFVPFPETTLDCADVRECINVAGLIEGAGTEGSPYSVTCPDILGCINVSGLIGGAGTVGSPYTVTCSSILSCVNVSSPLTGSGTGGSPYTLSVGPGLTVASSAVRANTSGTWGSGRLDFPCATSAGEPIYVDGSNQLRTSPPHTTSRSGGAASDGNTTDMSSVGNFVRGTTGSSNFGNPTCRDLEALIIFNVSAQVVCQLEGVWRFEAEYTINGGTNWNVIAASQWGTYPGTIGTVWQMVGSTGVTIAPGQTINIRFRQRVTTLVASQAGSSYVQGNTGWSVIGGTV